MLAFRNNLKRSFVKVIPFFPWSPCPLLGAQKYTWQVSSVAILAAVGLLSLSAEY